MPYNADGPLLGGSVRSSGEIIQKSVTEGGSVGCTGESEGSGAILYDLSWWVHGTVHGRVHGMKHVSRPTERQRRKGSLLSTVDSREQ